MGSYREIWGGIGRPRRAERGERRDDGGTLRGAPPLPSSQVGGLRMVRAARRQLLHHLVGAEGPGVGEMWARCGGDMGEMWARCGRGAWKGQSTQG